MRNILHQCNKMLYSFAIISESSHRGNKVKNEMAPAAKAYVT